MTRINGKNPASGSEGDPIGNLAISHRGAAARASKTMLVIKSLLFISNLFVLAECQKTMASASCLTRLFFAAPSHFGTILAAFATSDQL
jgi:hypothetical protein